MEIKNNAGAPQRQIRWVQTSLVGIHFILFVLTAVTSEYITVEGSARALP